MASYTPISSVSSQLHSLSLSIDGDTYLNLSNIIDIPSFKDNFQINEKIAEGSFSVVFRATSLVDDYPNEVAIKFNKGICGFPRYYREYLILRQLGGKNYILKLLKMIRYEDIVILIFPFFPHQHFQEYFTQMSIRQIQDYLRFLLTSLAHLHSHGYIHRDIKPSNCLYSPERNEFLLIDFGFSQLESEVKSTPDIATIQYQQHLHRKKAKITKSNVNSIKREHDSPEDQSNMNIPISKVLSSYLNGPTDQEDLEKFSNIFEKQRLNKLIDFSNLDESDWNYLTDKQNIPIGVRSFIKRSLSLSSHSIPSSYSFSNHPTNPINPSTILSNPFIKKNNRLRTNSQLHGQQLYPRSIHKYRQILPNAAREGTRGFRAPEILLGFQSQTSAIDIWSVGVILLSLLTKRHPFFDGYDDFENLIQIAHIVGPHDLIELAKKYGRIVTFNDQINKVNIREYVKSTLIDYPPELFHLLDRLLTVDFEKRFSAVEALQHPFFQISV